MAEKNGRLSPEERQAKMQEHFAKVREELGLTPDQQAIFQSQRSSAKEDMKAIMQDDSLTREEKKEQMLALKESNKASLASYLTSDQMQKLEEMRAEHKARRQEMGKGKKGLYKKKQGGPAAKSNTTR